MFVFLSKVSHNWKSTYMEYLCRIGSQHNGPLGRSFGARPIGGPGEKRIAAPKIKYNEASQIATGPHFVLSKNNAPNIFKSTGFSVSYISETYYMNEKPQYVSSNHEDVLLPIFFFMGKDGNLWFPTRRTKHIQPNGFLEKLFIQWNFFRDGGKTHPETA